jgi:hypothetical protein
MLHSKIETFKMRKTYSILVAFTVLSLAQLSAGEQGTYLYKTSLVQAAPGRILDVIEVYKTLAAEQARAGNDEPLLMMRHSQGDRWDLLLLFPMSSYLEYYQSGRIAKRKASEQAIYDKLAAAIAWQEDVFVFGPPLAQVRKEFTDAGLFHVEMFESLPGKETELYKQREMENIFSGKLNEPQNLIFTRDQGAAWDVFTIGCFRNLKQYAQSEDVSKADQEAAAKLAGFESASQIGPYLRTLISLHHDTLAVAVK